MSSNLKALCKICNGLAPVDQFKLDFRHKQMVCLSCQKGKILISEQVMIEKKEEFKPIGWDSEDEYLEKASRVKREDNQAQFSRIDGSDKVKCICRGCKYGFRFDPVRKQPRTCPYCNKDIPALKRMNLL